MDLLVWPPWIEISLGGVGVGLALWSIGRRRAGEPMHPHAAKADIGLLLFGALLALVGAVRWFEL